MVYKVNSKFSSSNGPSGVSGTAQMVSDPRARKMPPIVAKFQKVDTTTVNSIKAQTSGQVTFEYAASGLKIRTSNAADHQSVVRYLDGRGAEFHTTPIQGKW